MISGESAAMRCVMGRVEGGEDVVASLRELARFEKIDAGSVRAQGVVEAAELARYDPVTRGYVTAGAVPGAAELVSLEGNVSLEAGSPSVRLWAVLAAGATGELAAGLLVRARAVYVEFFVEAYDDGDLERRDDAATGLRLWRPPRRR